MVAYVIGAVSEKEAEEGSALQESEKKHSEIVAGSSIPTFVLNTEHKITHWNSAFEALTGMKSEEVIGTANQWKAFYPAKRPVMADLILSGASNDEFKEKYGDKYRASFIEGSYEALDFFPDLADGGKWLLFTAAPLMDTKGNITGAIETLQDFTERKRAEESLEESEKEHQIILNYVPVSIFHIDTKGRFVHVNEILAKRYGLKPADFKGKSSKELFPEEAEEYIKSDRAVLSSGEPQVSKIRKIKAPEGVRWVRLDKVPIKDAEGNVTGIIGFELDITERKRAEEMQLQLLSELSSANKELKDFAHIVSHDLKAPLRGIGSLAEWLSTDYSDKLDVAGQEHLDLLGNRVQRMQRLIDGILRYSKIGRLKEEKEEVNLNSLISEVIDLIDPPESIAIEVADKLPTIYCEQTKMEQVFQNLLSNAVRYMDKPNGKVTIGCTVEGEYWKFSVADNGPGIDEVHYERIFQIFQTLKPSEEAESTGVGLSIVKKIVEMNGGKIWVESKVGEGSTFFFTVPKVTEEAKG